MMRLPAARPAHDSRRLPFAVQASGLTWPNRTCLEDAFGNSVPQARFLTLHHRAITVGSGFLRLVVAAIGWWVDIRPD